MDIKTTTMVRFEHRLAQDYTVQVSYGPLVVPAGTVLLESSKAHKPTGYLYKTVLYVVVIPAEYVEIVPVGT